MEAATLFFDGEVGEESLHFSAAHVLGGTVAVEADKAFDPVHVGLFDADRIVLEPESITHLIEQGLVLRVHAAPGCASRR